MRKPTAVEMGLIVILVAGITFMLSVNFRIAKFEEAFVEAPAIVRVDGMPVGDTVGIEKATHLWAKISPKDSLKIALIESKIDSLIIRDDAFAKSIIYLDSCNNSKLTKQEKAERRGRFVGGLLRGLFPRIPGN